MIQQIEAFDTTELIDHTPFKPGQKKMRCVPAPLRDRQAKPTVGYLNASGQSEHEAAVLEWIE